MVQIDRTNVLAVYNELQFQASQMQDAIVNAQQVVSPTALGRDVVSVAAATAFGAKNSEIADLQQAHVNELVEAADRLGDAARQYGYTDADLGESFHAARGGLEARLADIRSAPPAAPRPAGS